jgi:hypothetical protein
MAQGGGGLAGAVDQPAAGSTTLFFGDFFPAAQHHLANRYPVLYGLMQPPWLAQACREQRLLLGSFVLRNPALLPVQLAGAGVGLWALRRLHRTQQTYLRHSLIFFLCMNLRCARGGLLPCCGSPGCLQPGRGLQPVQPGANFWPSYARVFCSSIVCHILTARGTQLWGAAAAADVAFTGASSLCLIAFQVRRGKLLPVCPLPPTCSAHHDLQLQNRVKKQQSS